MLNETQRRLLVTLCNTLQSELFIIFYNSSPGNYSCGCNVGFELFLQNGTAGFSVVPSESGERDGDIFQRNKTCVPVMCSPLQAPENGLILSTQVYFRVAE
jgi:hypothetical protein